MSESLISKPVNAFFYGFAIHSTPVEYITDFATSESAAESLTVERALLELVRLTFRAGARWQLHESAKLSPHIARFLEMVILLGPDYPSDEWLRAYNSPSQLTEDQPDAIEYDIMGAAPEVPF